jgi:hypothetical protein
VRIDHRRSVDADDDPTAAVKIRDRSEGFGSLSANL